MKTSTDGLHFIETEEGKSSKMYLDKYKKPTIGVGHLIKPGEEYLLTANLTPQGIDDLLSKDIQEAEGTINEMVTVPLKQSQFDSLVSLEFNIGRHGFDTSTLHKKINAGASADEVIKDFSMWNSKGLLKNRRAKEAKLFTTGDYSKNEFNLTASEMSKYYKAA